MKKKYRHLTIYERDRIEALQRSGHSPQEIAIVLSRNKSTISREIKRNGKYQHSKKGRWKHSGEYKAEKAQKKYQNRRCNSKYECKKIEKDLEIKKYIVEKREEYGHFEGDTIVSGKRTRSKSALAVIQERKSRICRIKRIKDLRPDSFKRATNRAFREFNSPKSLTLDNGIENRDHEKISVVTYFCNPYSSWEKGGVENLNGMIRRFVPKKSNISKYSCRSIKKIEDILNNKPRKILGYKTPYEVARENNLLIC